MFEVNDVVQFNENHSSMEQKRKKVNQNDQKRSH